MYNFHCYKAVLTLHYDDIYRVMTERHLSFHIMPCCLFHCFTNHTLQGNSFYHVEITLHSSTLHGQTGNVHKNNTNKQESERDTERDHSKPEKDQLKQKKELIRMDVVWI